MKAKMPQYQYINLDSGWSEGCDEFGRWDYRRDLFPHGIRALSDYLARNGHKLGLYILPGIRKEAIKRNAQVKNTGVYLKDLVLEKRQGNGFKGSTYMPDKHTDIIQKYYNSIAEQFSDWGVSFVKVDGCGPGGGDPFYPNQSPDNRACLRMLSNAFKQHSIWLEISWYMDSDYATDWAEIANGARIYIDIESYSTKTMTSSHRVFQRITQTANWADLQVIGPRHGFFLDLDVVVVGMTVDGVCVDGLDNDDVRLSYISFWALVSSVFCIGADPRCIPEKYLRMLNHPVIICIHQSGIMAQPIRSGNAWQNRKQVWWKRMPDNSICVGLFNTHVYKIMLGLSHEVKFKLSDIGLESASIKDIWTGEMLGVFNDTYSVSLRPGQCQMLLLTSHGVHHLL
ncbi:glycoside hydrolase superfamily [Phycomyces blakesleeanus]|uniref:alpha-galactosidase n=1 Tax=Phycomyces blakesleeanus TaxID=4837 RepID=A0ABR3ANV8_PHYBL